MQTSQKNIAVPVLSILAFMALGCSIPDAPVKVVLPSSFSEDYPPYTGTEQRFQAPVEESPTPIESAIDLSKKCVELSEKTSSLRGQNDDLLTENHRLTKQVTTLEAQLQQAQKELDEASDLLREMLIELNNWKVNVLGFQREMRDADTAQLEALLKILGILGGELKTKTAKLDTTGSTVAQLSDSGQFPAGKTKTLGQSNE